MPGCTGRHVQIHHIVHWTGDDGPTETWNLISLCPHHHRMHHRGELHIAGDADKPVTLMFTDARGSPIQACGRPIPPTGPLPAPSNPYRHPIGERLNGTWLYFNPPARDRPDEN